MAQRLIESDPLVAAMFHSSADVFVVVAEDGNIVLANGAAELLLGWTPESLVGRPVEVLVPRRFARHTVQRESFASRPSPRAMGRGLLYALHADGTEIPVDIGLTPISFRGQQFVCCTIRDMRGRISAPETLRVQATALRSAANGIVITDRNGIIAWVNPAACAITGYQSDELLGRHTRLLKSGEHGPEFYADLWATISTGHTWSGTIVNRRKDGVLYYEEQTIAPVVDERGEVSHFIAIKQDVTARREAEERLAAAHAELAEKVREIESLNRQLLEKSIRDPLTGLHNRRFLEEVAVLEAERAARLGEPLELMVLDIDHFKQVNDLHGHDAGDAVLRAVAQLIRMHARASDLVCRYGGDEFVCILAGIDEPTAAERADHWRKAVESAQVVLADGSILGCTVSVGVAAFFPEIETLEVALRRADAALYDAKHRGRNRVVAAE